MIQGHVSAEIPDWMIHFACPRNKLDRGLLEHEGNIPLPADGELSDGADEFEVLCAQLRFGGLVPGWPDGFGRKYSPRPKIVAQSASRIDFASRESVAGIAFLRHEFLQAGACNEVIDGRPDLCFDDLLAWKTDNQSAEMVSFSGPQGEAVRTLGLPLYLPRTTFTRVGVLVDDAAKAQRVRDLLTRSYLALPSYQLTARHIRRRLADMFVLWPLSTGDLQVSASRRSLLPGLEGFAHDAAVRASRTVLRQKVAVDWAVHAARYEAGKFNFHPANWDYIRPHEHRAMFLAFTNDGGPIATFLISSGIAEAVDDGCYGDEWRLDVGIDDWCRPSDQRAQFQRAAEAMRDSLDFHIYVRSYGD